MSILKSIKRRHQIKNIFNDWRKNGEKFNHAGIPFHPEFIYRRTGEWRGWADFIGCKNSPALEKKDNLESKAFAQFNQDKFLA